MSCVCAQSMTEVKYKLENGFARMQVYQPAANYDRLFVVFNADDLYSNELETRLINHANQFKAKTIVCDQNLTQGDWQKLLPQISNDSAMKPFVFARGRSAQLAFSALRDDGFGLLMSPEFDSTTIESMKSEGGVLLAASSDSIYARLSKAGFWVKDLSLVEPESLFEVVNYPSIQLALNWSDSMLLIMNDSTRLLEMKAAAGLHSEVPEVLRQGKVIKLDMFITNPTDYRIEVLNLSSEVLWSQTEFLGKGNHRIDVPTKDLDWGVYHIEVEGGEVDVRYKFIIRG